MFSIHTSAREVTQGPLSRTACKSCFNPRLRMGGDDRTRERACFRRCFNPHLRRGGDRLCHYVPYVNDCFNPHLRGGGASDFAAQVFAYASPRFQSAPHKGR